MMGIFDYPLYNYFWSSFVPESGFFNYGNLSEYGVDNFAIDPNGDIWHLERDSINFEQVGIYRSVNGFTEPEMIANLGEGDTSVVLRNGTYRYVIYSSKEKNSISVFLTGSNIFNSGNKGGGYRYYSTDNGTSWIGEPVIRGSIQEPVWGQVSNRNIAPYISPFSDFTGVIDNDGILHVTLYGIGKGIVSGDTTEIYTILYWNSRDKTWIAVSDPATEGYSDEQHNIVYEYSPGWGCGQSLPNISVSKDGKIVIVGWVSPEYIGAPGAKLNIYPGDGSSASKAVYYTDLVANISYNGGRSWSNENIFPLKNQTYTQEQFLIMNDYLKYDSLTGKIRLDYVYQIDEIPGNSGLGINSANGNNRLYYDSLIIQTDPVTVREDFVLYDYSLSQNYPNPFSAKGGSASGGNPNTKIRYVIGNENFVQLKVYNILGEEIVTLVNEHKPAGKYEISFSGKDLASGVYIYQLKAGNFVQAKKMIFLK